MTYPLKVVRFNLWIDPIFDNKINTEASTDLDVLNFDDDEIVNEESMSKAIVYHVSPAKDELPIKWQVNSELLDKCPNLLCVSSGGAGHDTIDVEECTRRGIVVVNQRGLNSFSVAEMTIGLMLSVSRRIAESDRNLRSKRNFTREDLMGKDLRGKTLGLVGIGFAGTATSKLANALGMRVLAYDPYLHPNEIHARSAEPATLDKLLATSDIVSLHCPRNSTTIGMFNKARFMSMKKGAYFISTARGDIHDEYALYEAIFTGHLSGAGLDVWSEEPPRLDHPLLSLSNVVATYRTAGVSHEGRFEVASQGAEQIIAILNGEVPERIVNPEVLPIFKERHRKLIC